MPAPLASLHRSGADPFHLNADGRVWAGAVYANQPRQTPGLPENKQFSGNNTGSVLRDQPALLPHSILSAPTCHRVSSPVPTFLDVYVML
jgi:hypothetical protein